MLKCEDNPSEWRMACAKAFSQPMGADYGVRQLLAICEAHTDEKIEFKNAINGFEFSIPTKLFSLIPHKGAKVNIDPVHYAVFFNRATSKSRIDLITGRPR